MARPTENADKNPNNKKALEMSPSLIMLIANGVMIIVMIVGMIVMYTLFESSITKKFEQLGANDEQSQMENAETPHQEGILLDLGSDIYNLADTNARRYLKAGIAMEISKTQEEIAALEALAHAKPSGGHGHGAEPAADPNADIAAVMERYKPAIKDSIITVLSSKTSDELSTPTGKEIAKEEILELVNNLFEGQREVMRISFGQFIIQ